MSEKYEPRECPNCGDLFVCTGDMNCQCATLEIPEKVQNYISARFEGCLCRKCIAEIIEKLA